MSGRPEGAIEFLRRDLAAEFGPRARRALSRWPVTVGETAFAGIPCQSVAPEGGAAHGRLLYFFGGGYVSGAPEYDLPITAALAALAGVEVVAPRYALAPEHPFPAGLEQAVAVHEALAALGPLSIAGESAGGGMALAVVHAAFGRGTPPPDRLVLLSPWADLTPEATGRGAGIDDPTLDTGTVALMADLYLAGASPRDPAASPALAPIPEGWPPTLLTTGSRDILGPGVRALAAGIAASGAACRLIDEEGMWHVFEAYDELAPSETSLRAVAAFLTTGCGVAAHG